MPIVPPAPVRFSITICWPIARDTGSPTTRATKSRPPPGASGTMNRTGRGHAASVAPCARAAFGPCGAWAIPPSSAMPPAPARLINVRRSILGNSFSPSCSLKSILHFDVGLRNDLAEFLRLRRNELAVLRRSHDPRHNALRVQRLRDRPVAQGRHYDAIEARDDRARRGGGREQPEPVEELVALELGRRLRERSRVRQLRHALARSDGDGAQPA